MINFIILALITINLIFGVINTMKLNSIINDIDSFIDKFSKVEANTDKAKLQLTAISKDVDKINRSCIDLAKTDKEFAKSVSDLTKKIK